MHTARRDAARGIRLGLHNFLALIIWSQPGHPDLRLQPFALLAVMENSVVLGLCDFSAVGLLMQLNIEISNFI